MQWLLEQRMKLFFVSRGNSGWMGGWVIAADHPQNALAIATERALKERCVYTHLDISGVTDLDREVSGPAGIVYEDR